MAGMEDQLSQILGNPQIMQQIAALAKSMNTQPSQPQEPPQQPESNHTSADSGLNLSALQGLLNAGQRMGIDKDQQTLLKALHPYLSQGRIVKLERAMHAAKLAQTASLFLNNNASRSGTGR